jgi:tryptophan synthase beta chain
MEKLVNGYFGVYGGCFVPEVLKEKLDLISEEFKKAVLDKNFIEELNELRKDFSGRPTPLYHAKNLSEYVGSKIYLKREDLNHTGSHKINNTIGQILLAKRMNKSEIIAETGAGQHGVATATVAAFMNMKCKVFMGKEDALRQPINVKKMKTLGAEVIEVTSGTQTLKEAVDEAIAYYCENSDSYYLLGSAVGPHPYPTMVRFFQSVIGEEAKKQFLEKEKTLPDSIFACIGGGSNAIGIFSAFIEETQVSLYAAEGGGIELKAGKTAATLTIGKPFNFQGAHSYCILNEENLPANAYSISSGLDYPGIGPEHSYLKDLNRVSYVPVYDDEAIEAFKLLSKIEGIIPAIESAHAISLAVKLMKDKNKKVIINLSGRGDKDLDRFL